MKMINRVLAFVLVLAMLLPLAPIQVFAADENVTVISDGTDIYTFTDYPLTVTYAKTEGTKVEYKENKWMYAYDGNKIASDGSATLIFENTSSNKQIMFVYQSAEEGTEVIEVSGDGVIHNGATVTMTPNATCTIRLSIKAGGRGRVEFSNFKPENVVQSGVQFVYDTTLGSVQVNGSDMAAGNSYEIPQTGVTVTATPASGATFLGWINEETGAILPVSNNVLNATSDLKTVRAAFASADSEAWFYNAGKTHLYLGLDTALTKITSGKIILAADGTLLAGDYEIPSGVTLLIPFDADGTAYYDEPKHTSSYTKPTAFRTLNMASGANITVASGGKMSVSAKHYYTVGGKSGGGATSGASGFVVMSANSKITVNSNANLYAWGYIVNESSASKGSVVINKGGTVHEYFQIQDFRGGTQTSSMKGPVFPFSQYYVQNVEVPMTLYAGATEKCFTTIHLSILGDTTVPVKFVGGSGSGAMFELTSEYLTKEYADGRLKLDIYGNLAMNGTKMDISYSTINTQDYVLPINGSYSVSLHSGATMNVSQDLALLPGAELTIDSGSTVKVNSGKSIYVYDYDEWGGFCGASGIQYKAPSYTYSANITAPKTDAKIVVNGTLDATSGKLYTTESGANITSTAGGTVKIPGTSNTVTYQQGANGEQVTKINVISPKLTNADGSILATTAGKAATYEYRAGHQKWDDTHTVKSLKEAKPVKPASDKKCAEVTYNEEYYFCSCGSYFSDSEGQNLVPAEEVEIHTYPHVAVGKYITNGTSHWKACEYGCDTRVDLAEHTDEEHDGKHNCGVCGAEDVFECFDADDNNSCDECGKCIVHHYEDVTCKVCGADLMLIYGNKFSPGNAEDKNRATTAYSMYLTKGSTITLKDNEQFYWAIYKTADATDIERTGEYIQYTWHNTKTVTITEDGWVALLFRYTADGKEDTTKTFDLSKPVSDYVEVKVAAHEHSYKDVVTPFTCTEQGYTTHTCSCGESYVDTYTEARHQYYGLTCYLCGAEMPLEYGNKFSSTDTARASAVLNMYFPKGTVLTVKNTSEVHLGVYKVKEATATTGELKQSWATTYTVTESSWYGIALMYQDAKTEFDLSTYLSDYITVDMPDWDHGNRYASGHESNKARISTAVNLYLPAGSTIALNDTNNYRWCIYKDNDGVPNATSLGNLGTNGWHDTTPLTVETDGWYGVTIKHWAENNAADKQEFTAEELAKPLSDYITVNCAHSYKSVVTEPTCTEVGYTTYTCSFCGDSYTGNEQPALGGGNGHDEVTIPAKDATCTEPGLTEGKQCSRCGEITVPQEESSPAEGHLYYDLTCSKCGGEMAMVRNNRFASADSYDKNRLSSEYNLYLEKGTTIALKDAATYRWAGAKVNNGTTSNYAGWFTANWVDQPETLAEGRWVGIAIKHSDDSDFTDEERRQPLSYYVTIEKPVPHEHSYESVVTEPTCTEEGYTTYTCSCGDSYIDDKKDALGGSHVEEITYEGRAATCTIPGLKAGKKCSRCGEILAEPEYISATGHTYVDGVCACDHKENENLWSGRTATFVGDSITAGSSTDKIYHQYLKESLGLSSAINKGIGGSCISVTSNYGTSPTPLINRYQEITSTDLIFVFMGTNDYGHATPLGTLEDTTDVSFYGALNIIVPALKQQHPESKIVFATPLHRYLKSSGNISALDTDPNLSGHTLSDYVEAIKLVCAINEVSVIDLYTESESVSQLDPEDETYFPDNLHPNAAGHEIVAGIMEKHLLGYEPLTEAPEAPEETNWVYGNRYYDGEYTYHNTRISTRLNLYLEAGTTLKLKDASSYKWSCYKDDDETPSNTGKGNLGSSGWHTNNLTVAEDGWYGITIQHAADPNNTSFTSDDLKKPLTDYVIIEGPDWILNNKFASSENHSRISSRDNFQLPAGTTLKLNDPENFDWACAKITGNDITKDRTYFPNRDGWNANEEHYVATVEEDSLVGITIRHASDTKNEKTFTTEELLKPLSYYVTIEGPELIYGNQYSSGNVNDQTRISLRSNLWLKAGTELTLKDHPDLEWACYMVADATTGTIDKTIDKGSWEAAKTVTVPYDGYVGITIRHAGDKNSEETFEMSDVLKSLSDYVTITEPHTHTYGTPTWVWTGDETNGYTAATATFKCDCGHEQTVDAEVSSQVTVEPTETTEGTRVYTASVEFGGETYTDQQKVTIPATGEPEEPSTPNIAVTDPANGMKISYSIKEAEIGGWTLTLTAEDTEKPYVYLVKYTDADGKVSEKIANANGKYTDGSFAIPEDAASVTVESALLGDVTGDGVLDSFDAAAVLRIGAGLEEGSELQNIAAETVADGAIDSFDAAKILRVSAGLDSGF